MNNAQAIHAQPPTLIDKLNIKARNTYAGKELRQEISAFDLPTSQRVKPACYGPLVASNSLASNRFRQEWRRSLAA